MSERTGDIRHGDDHRPAVEARRGGLALGDHHRGAGGDRAGREPAPVQPKAPAREEHRSGRDGATVVAHRRHHPVESEGDRRVPRQERAQARTGRGFACRHGHGVLSAAGCGVAAAMLITGLRIVSGSSGAMPRMRSAPSTISENTGAATAPP